MKFDHCFLTLKCTHISEPIVNPDTDLADHVLCSFGDDEGNSVINVKYPISSFFPLWFKEGDLCVIDITRGDIFMIGKPVKE